MKNLPLENPHSHSLSQEALSVSFKEIRRRIEQDLSEEICWDELFDTISKKESLSLSQKSSSKDS